jgi:16S rRNA (guanine966-N2)-methyltransferase
VTIIRRNADKLGTTDRVRILSSSALALPASEPFDLIFADPPYEPGSGSAVIEAVEKAGWLAPGAWMSVETSRTDDVAPGSLSIEAQRDVGRARVTLLRRL